MDWALVVEVIDAAWFEREEARGNFERFDTAEEFIAHLQRHRAAARSGSG